MNSDILLYFLAWLTMVTLGFAFLFIFYWYPKYLKENKPEKFTDFWKKWYGDNIRLKAFLGQVVFFSTIYYGLLVADVYLPRKLALTYLSVGLFIFLAIYLAYKGLKKFGD